MSLINKTVLITGSNKGIGRAVANECLKRKANIIFVVRKKNKEFLNFFKKFSHNKNNRVISFDLSDEKKMISEINKLSNYYKTIDYLINNAGVAHGSIFEMTSNKKIKDIFEINFFSQLKLIQLVLRFLKTSKNAHIINIASAAGVFHDRGNIAYGTSKAALIFASKILANEFKNYNIKVTSLSPGLVDTQMIEYMNLQSKKKLQKKLKVDKILKPKKIADIVLKIVLNKIKNTNGKNIILDKNFSL